MAQKNMQFFREGCDRLSNNLKLRLKLKPKQGNAVECLLKKDDVLAVLPTGYSKSLHIFELFGVAASIGKSDKLFWLFGL